MDFLKSFLGIDKDKKRLYRFDQEQMDAEDFHAATVFTDIVFGAKGYAESLGPTWSMIHDPRFVALENITAEITRKNRRGLASESASYSSSVSSNGTIEVAPQSTDSSDLAIYSLIVGEGRHFASVVTAMGQDPNTVYSWTDEAIWALIHQECPNYFSREDKPNATASLMFKFIKADILGLMSTYAPIANVQEWVNLQNPNHLASAEELADPEFQRVWLEIEYMEKALLYRAMLRAVTVKVMQQTGLKSVIEQSKVMLTDFEIDDFLVRIYNCGTWPECKLTILTDLSPYIWELAKTPYEERLAKQIADSKKKSAEFTAKLASGEIQPINRHTDGEIAPEKSVSDEGIKLFHDRHIDVSKDSNKSTFTTKDMNDIVDNPTKLALFQLIVAAEKAGDKEMASSLVDTFHTVGRKFTPEEEDAILAPFRRKAETTNSSDEFVATSVTDLPLQRHELDRLEAALPTDLGKRFRANLENGSPALSGFTKEEVDSEAFDEYHRQYIAINRARSEIALMQKRLQEAETCETPTPAQNSDTMAP